MGEVKGVTWDFEGNQLSIRSTLALAYVCGFRGRDLVTAVAVCTAESQRYAKAYHRNHEHEADGSNTIGNDGEFVYIRGVDHGLMQINLDELLPFDDGIFDPKINMKSARRMYRDRGFQPWAAYNSGAYERYVPEVQKVYDRQAWRLSIPRWEAHDAVS